MSMTDPLSLTEAKRLAGTADTILLRATRDADLETPIGAFLRLDDGGPGLPARVGRGRRAPRPLQLPRQSARAACSRSATARHDPDAPGRRRPLRTRTCRPRRSPPLDPLQRPARLRAPPPGAARRGHAALHRRRGRRARLRRHLERFEPTVPAPGPRPGRRPAGRVHRDRPRHRLRPPHPPALARSPRSTPRRPTSRAATGSPSGRSSRRSSGRPARRPPSWRRLAASRPARDRRGAGPVPARPIATSLGRDQYIRAVEVAKDAIAAGEAIQVVLARRQSFDLPAGAGRPPARRHRPVPRPPPRQPEPVPVLHPHPGLRGRGRQPGAPPPGRGRPDDHAPDRRHPAARRDPRRRRPPGRRAPPRPQGARRARDARGPRPQRPRARRPARHRESPASTWRSSATATSSTW